MHGGPLGRPSLTVERTLPH